MGGRVCTACAHAQRKDIDAAVVAGEAKRGIARRFGLSPDAVERHVKHVAEMVRTAEVKKARTLAGILDKSHRQVNAIIRRALAAGEDDRVLRAIKERRDQTARGASHVQHNRGVYPRGGEPSRRVRRGLPSAPRRPRSAHRRAHPGARSPGLLGVC